MDISLKNFRDQTVVVVGDVMLDKYLWGSSNRISPEAPVPVVNLEKETFVAGGAANVAANVAALGGSAILLGVVGADDLGEGFGRALRDRGVSGDFLIMSRERPTTLKTRVVANNQQIARVDRESTKDLSEQEQESLLNKFVQILEGADIVILSDYAKGVLSNATAPRLITKARSLGVKVLVDPKGKDYKKYEGAFLITPNKYEINEASEYMFSKEFSGDLKNDLLEKLSIDSLLVTKGADGMTVHQRDRDAMDLEARTRKVFDVTGAGDTVIATTALGIAAGHDLVSSANLANIAAGIVVGKIGTSVVTLEELDERIQNP